jgi:hypothetical protein
MQDMLITIGFEASFKERLEAMAKVERRTLADQAAYLMEKGLLILERQQAQQAEAGQRDAVRCIST